MALVIRQDQSTLSVDDQLKFVHAVRNLKGTVNRAYDTYVQMHWDYSDAGHGGPAFLPWHREFLRRFELDLQRVANDATLGLPYWNWSVDSTPLAGIWNSGFMGGNGQTTDGQVTNGPFAYKTGYWPLNVRTPEEPNPYLRRRFGSDPNARSLPTPDDVLGTLRATPYDVAPWDEGSGSGFRNTLEGWIPGPEPQMHNRVHVWVGGSMLPMTSPNDPVFWLHHCFIDKLWADWQVAHPDEGYLPTAGARPGHNLNDPMPPWNQPTDTVRPANVLDHRALGYRYEGYLLPGEELSPFQWVGSPRHTCLLWYDNYGDVILSSPNSTNFLWTSGTGSNFIGAKCRMETNGNLVSYDPSGKVIWDSKTAGNPNSYLVVRDEGYVAICSPKASDPIWSRPPPQRG